MLPGDLVFVLRGLHPTHKLESALPLPVGMMGLMAGRTLCKQYVLLRNEAYSVQRDLPQGWVYAHHDEALMVVGRRC